MKSPLVSRTVSSTVVRRGCRVNVNLARSERDPNSVHHQERLERFDAFSGRWVEVASGRWWYSRWEFIARLARRMTISLEHP